MSSDNLFEDDPLANLSTPELEQRRQQLRAILIVLVVMAILNAAVSIWAELWVLLSASGGVLVILIALAGRLEGVNGELKRRIGQ